MNTAHHALTILASLLVCAGPLSAQINNQNCSKPSILRVTKQGSDLYYQLDLHKQHKLFQLGEVSNAVRDCSPERMVFVVADPTVSPTEMLIPGKEQIKNARYFVQLRTGDLIELSFVSSFPVLPITPDIKGSPFNENYPPHPPTKVPRGSK